MSVADYTAEAVAPFAELALGAVEREYPNHVSHWLNGAGDARPPHALTPIFYGCLDWHSAVHSHWLLARVLGDFPAAPFAAPARARLARAFTAANVVGELEYLGVPERVSFERPYGLAWLLTLAAELARSREPAARAWHDALAPLETLAAERLWNWVDKIAWPIRGGEHSQSAFAFGLMLDWADATGRTQQAARLRARCRDFYENDRYAPLAYEPSAHDFLSPALAEADLMRRVLTPDSFADWLDDFLPRGAALSPVAVADRADPKLAHFDGLNLSRAWMLRGVATALPPGDARSEVLLANAGAHARAGLAGISGEHYAGTHWLGTFAVYWLSGMGLDDAAAPAAQ